MKRLILLAFLSFLAMRGIAQTNSFFGIYGGGGIATANNYDVGTCGGFEFLKGLFDRSALGATVFYQGYAMLYDHEAYSAKNGTGIAGVSILNRSSYIFFAPKFTHDVGKKGFLKYYFDAGVGYNMSGKETMRKWDNTHGAALGNYDSTIDTSPNINKLIFRVGVGFTEFLSLHGHWWFTVTEDFGFLPKSVSTSSDVDNPERTQYTPHNMNPAYVSLQIGITHTKN